MRGVPLITVLFVATFVFPLVLPAGWRIDPFWRVVIGIVLFQAAYMAETVRGGLQSIPKAQHEAALSLGLRYWQVQASVILPQALVAVIPAFVNNLLSTFMDTSLVTVVSMYDLTGWSRPRWPSCRRASPTASWRRTSSSGRRSCSIRPRSRRICSRACSPVPVWPAGPLTSSSRSARRG